MKKKNSRSTGSTVESILRGLLKLIGGIFKLLGKVIVLFGLWVPLLYGLFGLILHYTMGFEPFDFSMFSTFYIVGGIVCFVIVVIISAYNLFINPIKRAREKKKQPRVQEEPAKELKPPLTEEKGKGLFKNKTKQPKVTPPHETTDAAEYSDAQTLDWIPPQEHSTKSPTVAGERPQVYFSALKPDILVHEYSDHFELFRVEGDRLVSIGTEYK